jgi:hypothetical protein
MVRKEGLITYFRDLALHLPEQLREMNEKPAGYSLNRNIQRAAYSSEICNFFGSFLTVIDSLQHNSAGLCCHLILHDT